MTHGFGELDEVVLAYATTLKMPQNSLIRWSGIRRLSALPYKGSRTTRSTSFSAFAEHRTGDAFVSAVGFEPLLIWRFGEDFADELQITQLAIVLHERLAAAAKGRCGECFADPSRDSCARRGSPW